MHSNDSRCTVMKSVNLKSSFKSPLQRQYPDCAVRGGMFADHELAWLYNGPLLRIFDAATGTVISAWDFTTVTHDNRTEITSIIEYCIPESNRSSMKENQLYFIVSYASRKDPAKASFISLCHPRTSRILHTITTREKVTCLSLITAKKDHSNPIGGIVKLMCGALAVGTTSGNLLIVDIKEIFTCARQGCVDRKQNRFSEMVIMDFKHNENNIKEKLNKSDEFHHVAVLLPIADSKRPEEGDLKITALTYISQCTMLAVGLKNGAFQLWDMSTLKKVYRSGVPSAPARIVKFGFQEPCNDPQSFCYLWVLHESQAEQNDVLPFAIMYACLFKKIITVPEYGIHYKNFIHCKKRFDLDIDMERSISGRCIACSVVSNTPSNILRHVTSVDEDVSKINLFVMVFETWEQVSDSNSCITLAIFDMNQWYKAQMPQLVYQGGSVQFVNFQSLEHLSERKGTVMDMRIKKDTIQQFLTFNLSEEYSYPSSLSFDTVVLTDSKLIHARLPGAQRNVLDKIVADGPSGIINPNKYFSECKDVGLWPYFSNNVNNLFAPSQVQQRNFILTILLEHKFSSFLVACVKQWADGSRGVSGCTLPNLIKWAWDCVTRIKQLTDTVCIPLFDYSGDDLDRENYQKLKHCVQLMHTIRDLLTYIHRNYKQYLLEEAKLKHQVDALKLITKYFDTIIWCLDSNLLPEKVTSSSEKCVPTYMMNLMQYTEQRRDELRAIVNNEQYFMTESTVPYIIDSILQQEAIGEKMRAQWERESNGLSNGCYPPVTLQSLLRMILMPGLSTDAKHFIMIYFLLDVCDYHRDEDMKQQLLSYSVVFSIDSAFFSLVQACWFVDHEKFDEAAGLLLNDAVILQLKSRKALYRILMLACVCQGQYRLALRIEKLARMSKTAFNDDTFSVTVLLLNGLVMDAYFTVKENPIEHKKLLMHFFKVCDSLGHLKEIFKFPLSSEDEEEFMTYLDTCGNKDAGDLKIMYLLSRSRYVEAIDVNHQLNSVVPKFGVVGQDTTRQKVGVGRTTTRDILVNAFGKTLPNVTNDLINFYRKEKSKMARFKTLDKPTPLSVVVHTDTSHQIPIYKSSFESVVEAAILKTAETWSNVSRIVKLKRGHLNLKSTPFLKTNFITPRKETSLYSERDELSTVPEEQRIVDENEPPVKRARRSTFDVDNSRMNESSVNEESIRLSAAVETGSILCTPHVQKRLNKLLRNTPDSSPLTSILKSADSRFKQPQKVEFNMPETDPRRSKRFSTGQSRSPPKKFEEKPSEIAVQLTAPSQGSSVTITSANESQASTTVSTVQESFYSLDSDVDGVCNITDFVQETSSRPFHMEVMSEEEETTSSARPCHMEVMSEEETSPRARPCLMEVMSEDETSPPDNATSRVIMECMSEGETLSFNASKSIPDRSREDEIISVGETSIVSISDEEKSPSVIPERRTMVDNRASSFIVDSARMRSESLQPSRLRFHDSQSEPQIVQVEVHAPPQSVADDVDEMERETTSYAALQPLQESATYETDDHDQLHSDAGLREDFSIDTFEKETVLEQDSEQSDEDSDIEIIDDSTSEKQDDGDDSSSVASNDDASSRKSYESNYTASDSDIEDEEDGNSETNSAKQVEEVADSEEEVEEEEEPEVGVQEEEEPETEDEEVDESLDVLDVSEEEAGDGETEANVETFSTEHLDIDYDSLKVIMNTVNAGQTDEIDSAHPEALSNDPVEPSPSMLCNETLASVYEVVDTTSSDVLGKQMTPGSPERSGPTTDVGTSEIMDQSNVSVETVSVSAVGKDPNEDEPPLVFYFGENSVTSISEKLLSDESMNQSQFEVSSNVAEQSFDGNAQKTEDFSIVAVTEESEQGDLEAMDVSCGISGTEDISHITDSAQRTEDFSILAVTEEYDESSVEVKSSYEKGVAAASSYAGQDISANIVDVGPTDETDRTTDFTIASVSVTQENAEEQKCDEGEWASDSDEDIILEETGTESAKETFEDAGARTQAQPRYSEVETLSESSDPGRQFYQPQNVSVNIDVVEEADIGTTQKENDSEVERQEDIDEAAVEDDQNVEEESESFVGGIASFSQSNPCISIGMVEEIVGSGDSSAVIAFERTATKVETKGTEESLEVESVEEVVASDVTTSESARPEGSPQPMSAQHEGLGEAITHHSGSSESANEEPPRAETTYARIRKRSKYSEDTNEPPSSEILHPALPSEENIVQISPSQRQPESESPVRKAESELSFSMSIPDSPTTSVTLEPATPSRRSARIARRLSTESIPQAVAAEATPRSTRASRRLSMESMDAASDISAAESATTGTSKSGSRKRSQPKSDTHKSLIKAPALETIKSDEELSDGASVMDDDRLSTVSKASASSSARRSGLRSSSSKLNIALIQTPTPPKKRMLDKFNATAAAEMSSKAKVEGEYENYADSRRLTRSQQKSLQEYGAKRVPIGVEPPAPELESVQPGPSDEKSNIRTRSSARLTREKSPEAGSSKTRKLAKHDIQADSDSSSDDSSSRTSTASSTRRARGGRRKTRTSTRVELRKSSARPKFKTLEVVHSDEESMSNSVDEDKPSSQPRLPSAQPQTPRSKKQTRKYESEQSDRESLQSDVSGTPSVRASKKRVTRQSLAADETPQKKKR